MIQSQPITGRRSGLRFNVLEFCSVHYLAVKNLHIIPHKAAETKQHLRYFLQKFISKMDKTGFEAIANTPESCS